jgi:hypothetical protein
MKNTYKILIHGILFIGLVFPAHAQIKIPQASPAATLEQTIGLTEITIEYSRPSMKGRDLFAELTPVGQVWRTGANLSTKITISADVELEGKRIPAGTYSFYSIPGEQEWTVIINKKISWGTEYDESQDLERITVPTISTREPLEVFEFYLTPLSDVSGILGFAWGNAKVQMNIKNYDQEKTLASIEEIMSKPEEAKPGDFFAAANYYNTLNKDLKNALAWIDVYINNTENAYWAYRVKAQIQSKLGDNVSAIKTAELAIKIATEQGNDDYVRYTKKEMAGYKSAKK